MATKDFYHNINMLNVAQLLGARKQNLTTAERDALGGDLGLDNEGLFVWDTDLKIGFTWDGVEWIPETVEIEGDVIFKGLVDASASLDGQVEAVVGYEYVVGTAGTLTATGITFLPSGVAESGDKFLFTSEDTAYVFQRNDEQATETTLGNVRLATEAEVLEGVEGTSAVTPATLQVKLEDEFVGVVRQYTVTANIPAITPLTVEHNLGLVNQNAFTVNVMKGNSRISVDVDSVDANTITLTSLLPIADAVVTIQGAPALV